MEYANAFLVTCAFLFLIQLISVCREFSILSELLEEITKAYSFKFRTDANSIEKKYEFPRFIEVTFKILLYIALGIVIFILGGFIATLISIMNI